MDDTHDLRDRVCLNPPATTDVIAAGPITHQPHSRAYRVVLVNKGNRFVVWNQYFDLGTTVDHLSDCDNGFFGDGSYFRPNQLAEATECFGRRIADTAHHIKSIYREEAKQGN